MMLNTYEHGYTDAITGNQRTLGSDEYRAGYDRGIRYTKAERRMEMLGAGVLVFMVGIVMAMLLAELAGRMPV